MSPLSARMHIVPLLRPKSAVISSLSSLRSGLLPWALCPPHRYLHCSHIAAGPLRDASDMHRFNQSPEFSQFQVDSGGGPTPISRPTPLSIAHLPTDNGAPLPGGAHLSAPITQSNATAPSAHAPFDIFDEIEWSWAPTASTEQTVQYAYGYNSPDQSYLSSPSPDTLNHPLYQRSDSSFTPVSVNSSLPFPETPSSLPNDMGANFGFSNKPLLSTSLPTSVQNHYYHPTMTLNAPASSSPGAPNTVLTEWPSDSSPRPIRGRPVRKSESDKSNTATSRGVPSSTASRAPFLPPSPISRTPPSSITFLPNSPGGASSPNSNSFPSSPVYGQVRSASTNAPAGDASPDPIQDHESDEAAKKKRKRDPKESC